MGIIRRGNKGGDENRSEASGRSEGSQSTAMTRSQGGGGELMASSPFTLMRRMFDDVERMFEGFGFGGGLSPFGESRMSARMWLPRVDVIQQESRMLVRADLPGLDSDDIDVDVVGDTLVITGERRQEDEQQAGDVWRRERVYGEFRREIQLPQGVDPDRIEARFERGVLEVSIELPEQQRRRRVQIARGTQGERQLGGTAPSSPSASATPGEAPQARH